VSLSVIPAVLAKRGAQNGFDPRQRASTSPVAFGGADRHAANDESIDLRSAHFDRDRKEQPAYFTLAIPAIPGTSERSLRVRGRASAEANRSDVNVTA
jgi:hypothetical protein